MDSDKTRFRLQPNRNETPKCAPSASFCSSARSSAVGVESLDLLSHARRVYEQTKEMQEFPFELAADGLSLDRLLTNGDVVDTIHGLTPLCRTDLRRVGNGIANLRKGAGNEFDQKAVVPLIDASGRIEPGVLRGRISFYGMVRECESIDYEFADSGRHFGGQYARISLNAGFANYSHCARGYSLDVCVPLACTTNDILLTFRKLFETKQGDAPESPVCSASRLVDERPSYNYQSYIVLGVMGGITLVCFLASIYDAFILPELGTTAPDSCVGDNPVDVFEVIGSFGGQLIANAYYSVDTFFFQSGLLLSFLWFRTYRKNPRVANAPSTWVLFYVLVFFTFVYSPYLFQFPIFMGLPSDALGDCAKNYWWHFLYLNNYVHLKNACYVVSWYLATDMQMYVFAPLLIVPFTYSEVFGWVFALVLLAASTLANFITVIVLHFGPSNFNYGWQDPEAPKDPT
ncbi:Acyl-transf-3 domain-containing protein [Aphelenchoides fujianensis]|nr:Acyl-transf-3 domain-containing protein [Aphelenchoides fujianensis]